MKHKFPYKWNLSDGYPAKGIDYHGSKVFGTFICGGGSTMGYKLAGFDHLGGVEIDTPVADAYRVNHNPKYLYNEDIRMFNQRTELPDELFHLDLLDGSPPCSSFSMAGNREKDWGKTKQFREGQAKQTLDDLFFDYIALAKRLQPKIVLAENVKGLIQGNAKAYVHEIKAKFEDAGYTVQLFLLNAASMGVPQKRERVFFICQRKDLKLPKLNLSFDEQIIPFSAISQNDKEFDNSEWKSLWTKMREGETLERYLGYGFNTSKVVSSQPLPTIAGTQRMNSLKSAGLIHPTQCRKLNNMEFKLGSTFPVDYNFKDSDGINFPAHLIGMSVPPVMAAQIAHQIYLQWLTKLT